MASSSTFHGSLLVVIITTLAVLSLLQPTAAWNSLGHIAIAEIATRELTPEHVKELNLLTNSLREHMDNKLLDLPHNAILLDQLRENTGLFNEFHYITNPYQNGGDYSVPKSLPPPTNAVSSAFAAFRSLHFKGDITRVYGKAFSIITLTHLIGDMHQPFHAISLFNDHFLPPLGDMGGNLYKIHFTSENGEVFDQIHKFSDCIGGDYCDYYHYTATGRSNKDFDRKMLKLTEEVMTLFPKSTFTEDEIAPKFTSQNAMRNIIRAWAAESYNHAVDFYRAVPENGTPAPDVLEWMRYTFRRRIALAGYRLGYLLKHVNTKWIGDYPQYPQNYINVAWRGIFFLALFILVGILVVILKIACSRRNHKPSSSQGDLSSESAETIPSETDQLV